MSTKRGKAATSTDAFRRRRLLVGISVFLLLGLSLFTGKVVVDRVRTGSDRGTLSSTAPEAGLQPAADVQSQPTATNSAGNDAVALTPAAPGDLGDDARARRRRVYESRRSPQMAALRRQMAREDDPLFGPFRRYYSNYINPGRQRPRRQWVLQEGVSIWTPGIWPRPFSYPPVSYGGAATAAAAMAAMADPCLDQAAAVPKNAPVSIVYVDADATDGLNNGTSWTNAFTNLQKAMRTSSTAEIWVADGTYKATDVPDGDATDKKTYSFVLRSGMHVYGGFAGGETARSQRNPAVNETILDGDGAYHVVVGADNSTLDGVTVTGGDASGDWEANFGGGLFNFYSSPRINGCTFKNNRALDSGGAIANDYSDPIITNCIFVSNLATYGGAISNMNSNAQIINCTFNNNTAGFGGGVDNYWSIATVLNCIFWENILDSEDPLTFDNLIDGDTNVSFAGNTITYSGVAFPTPFAGLGAGDSIRVSGSVENNGIFLVASATANTVTLEQTLTAEPAPTALPVTIDHLTAEGADIYVDDVGSSVVLADYTYFQQDVLADPGAPDVIAAGETYSINSDPVHSSTTAAPGAYNTVVLDASASATDDFYNGRVITITTGPAAGQSRTITDYTGASRTATVSLPWFSGVVDGGHNLIYGFGGPPPIYTGAEEPGLLNPPDNVRLKTLVFLSSTFDAVGSDWFTYAPGDQSEKEDDDVGLIISVVSGPGAPQSRVITAYNATTQEVTVDSPWSTIGGSIPTTASTYEIWINTICYKSGTKLAPNVPTKDIDGNDRQETDVVDMGAYENGYDVTVGGSVQLQYAMVGNNVSADTVQLSRFGSRVDDYYVGMEIFIVGGTGAGQSATITAYDGISKVALVDTPWTTQPLGPIAAPNDDAISWYIIYDPVEAEYVYVEDGHELTIPDGQAAASEDNLTSFDVLNGYTHRYTIRNNGLRTIKLTGSPFVQLTGDGATQFSVINQPGSTGFEPINRNGGAQAVDFVDGDLVLEPGSTVDFVIEFQSLSHDVSYSAKVVIPTTVALKNPYDFVIGGKYLRVMPCTPTIALLGNDSIIGDQSDPDSATTSLDNYTDFGNIRIGRGEMIRTFKIACQSNCITPLLMLTNDPLLPNQYRDYVEIFGPNADDFVVIAQPEFPDGGATFQPIIENEGSVTFQVQFIGPDDVGERWAYVQIANNYSADGYYTFRISAFGNPDTDGGDAGGGTDPGGGGGGGGEGGGGGGSGGSSGCSMSDNGQPASFYLPFLVILAVAGLGRLRFAKAE